MVILMHGLIYTHFMNMSILFIPSYNFSPISRKSVHDCMITRAEWSLSGWLTTDQKTYASHAKTISKWTHKILSLHPHYRTSVAHDYTLVLKGCSDDNSVTTSAIGIRADSWHCLSRKCLYETWVEQLRLSPSSGWCSPERWQNERYPRQSVRPKMNN